MKSVMTRMRLTPSAITNEYQTAWRPILLSNQAAGIRTTSWRVMLTIMDSTPSPTAWNRLISVMEMPAETKQSERMGSACSPISRMVPLALNMESSASGAKQKTSVPRAMMMTAIVTEKRMAWLMRSGFRAP